jgi:hypothetical protein
MIRKAEIETQQKLFERKKMWRQTEKMKLSVVL